MPDLTPHPTPSLRNPASASESNYFGALIENAQYLFLGASYKYGAVI